MGCFALLGGGTSGAAAPPPCFATSGARTKLIKKNIEKNIEISLL